MNKKEQTYLIQKIRAQYMEQEDTELDVLKEMDAKVKRPARISTYLFGSLSALIMGSGMSLVMTDIGQVIGLAAPMLPGIIIGVLGMLLAAVNYPIYKKILGRRRKKYAKDILALSNKMMQYAAEQ